MTSEYKKAFAVIGNQILERWEQQSFDERALPSIACDILSEGHLEPLNPELLAAELVHQSAFDAMQTMTAFSDLALNVFQHPRFYIEVLYWVTGTTTIHEHSFSGAFYVWHGQSLNVEYIFREQKRFNSRFRIGDLKICKVERLHKGTIKPIHSGSALIHAVFHLDCPSVTVVVRTHQNPDAFPQLEYRYPSIAIDATQIDPAVIKRIQAINVGSVCFYWQDNGVISSFLKKTSIDDVYRIYRSLDLSKISETDIQKIENEIRSKEYGDEVLNSIEREKIVRHIVGFRRNVTDGDLRMCLALLANVSEKAEILKFISSEYQADTPEMVMAKWILSLSMNYIIDSRIKDFSVNDIANAIVSIDGSNAVRAVLSNEVALEEFMRR